MSGPTPSTDRRAEVFDLLGDEYEQVVWCHDPALGLRAIVAVHSTVLGPAMGGTRFLPYPDETAALVDVLRLARGMTYKQAVAGIDYGGGKAVILADPATVDREALLRSYGRHLHRMGGTYLTAEDVGTTQADMDLLRQETPFVTGTSPDLGGSGDPSPATAWGVYHAMRAVADRLWGSPALEGRHVAVAGVGKVGGALVGHLVAAGARVTVADPRTDAVAAVLAAHPTGVGRRAIEVVDHHEVHLVACDLLSPCALGAGLNADTIPALRCHAVCGAANNQLATPDDGERLADRGVLYVPDFVANAGGVINISEEPGGYDRERAMAHVALIEATTAAVLARADADGVTPTVAAERIAEDRLAAAPAT